jgi:SpoVK/Ycf46/Vps4 family AAA+-type ATPase
MLKVAVPSRFRKAVLLHLFKNLHPRPHPSTPLILGVHGPSGEGKTVQCLALFEELGVNVVPVSGGELESPNAGEPAEVIREAYGRAAAARGPFGQRLKASVLFLNDFDAAVGDWGAQVQYTVNRQTVFGELMHLADFPTQVKGRDVFRVPIVLTGNDFTRLYGPLVRLGRMNLFSWTPSRQERVIVLRQLYPELNAAETFQLLDKFPDEPIAFFSQLRLELDDDLLWTYIEDKGATNVFDDLAEGLVPQTAQAVSFARLVEIGQRLLQSRTLANHLRDV